MTNSSSPKPSLAPLYSGPAGHIWSHGLDLYGLQAQDVNIAGVMPGGPHNQPTPAEAEAVMNAGKNAYGPLKPWMLFVLSALLFFGLSLLRLPLWAFLLLGLLLTLALAGWPLYKQYKAFTASFAAREELTLLLSPTPTNAVSRVIEVGPDTPAQTLGPSDQPVAVVVRGLALPERVKLAGAVMRHTAMGQLQARQGGEGS